MSGTRVKDQEQKKLLAFLLLRKLQRCLKFWPGAGVKDQNIYFLLFLISYYIISYYCDIAANKIIDPSSINKPLLMNFQVVSSFLHFKQHP